MNNNEKKSSFNLLPNRLRIMTALGIEEAFRHLQDPEHLRIFLTEPDTNNFPPEMAEIKKIIIENSEDYD